MDTRGQPVQVGVIILFGFLVIAFATFQAVVVPQQNAEVEFQHSQRVQTDLVDVRNSVLTGVATGSAPFVEVELGTQYPPRVLAVNPGPPSGSLRTTSLRSMTIEDGGGTDVSGTVCPGTAESRSLTYSATYNVYTSPTVSVDNTVAYLSAQGKMVSLSDQRLVSGSTVNLVPLRGDYQASGSGTTSVGPVPGTVIITTLTDPTITVPTQLSQSVWNDLLASELDSGESATVDPAADTLTLELQGDYDVRCSPVGINGAPPSGARNGGGLGSGSGGGDVNPGGASDVVLTNVSYDKQTDVVTVTFENKGENDLSFKQARVPFTYSPTANTKEATYTRLNDQENDNLTARDSFEPVNQDITISAGSTRQVEFHFDENVDELFYGFSVVFSNGVNNRYFIEADAEGSGGGGGGDDPPSASIDDVTDNSQCSDTTGGGGCKGSASTDVAEFEVDWSASDDNGISDVTVELLDKNGNVVDSVSPAASGTSASGTVTLSESGGYGDDYTIRLTVTDSSNQVSTFSVSDTADGTDP